MHIEIVYAGGNTMKLEQIKKMARDNEVVAFFKELYRHSIQLLESVPDETMREVLSKNRNGRDGQDPKFYPYHIGVVDGFVFHNEYDCDTDKRLTDKIWLITDVMYVTAERSSSNRSYLEYEEEFHLNSFFDYHHLSMKLQLGTDEVCFTCEDSDADITVEDEVFLKALTDHDFLERIFGEHLVANYDHGVFVVSIRFFED